MINLMTLNKQSSSLIKLRLAGPRHDRDPRGVQRGATRGRDVQLRHRVHGVDGLHGGKLGEAHQEEVKVYYGHTVYSELYILLDYVDFFFCRMLLLAGIHGNPDGTIGRVDQELVDDYREKVDGLREDFAQDIADKEVTIDILDLGKFVATEADGGGSADAIDSPGLTQAVKERQPTLIVIAFCWTRFVSNGVEIWQSRCSSYSGPILNYPRQAVRPEPHLPRCGHLRVPGAERRPRPDHRGPLPGHGRRTEEAGRAGGRGKSEEPLLTRRHRNGEDASLGTGSRGFGVFF